MSSAQPTSVEISPADVVRVESAHGGRGADGGGGGGLTGTGRATTDGASSSCGGAVAGGVLVAGAADVVGTSAVVDVSFPGSSAPVAVVTRAVAVVVVVVVRIGTAPIDSTVGVPLEPPTRMAATSDNAAKTPAPTSNRRFELRCVADSSSSEPSG